MKYGKGLEIALNDLSEITRKAFRKHTMGINDEEAGETDSAEEESAEESSPANDAKTSSMPPGVKGAIAEGGDNAVNPGDEKSLDVEQLKKILAALANKS